MSRTNETNLLAPFEIWEVPLDGKVIKFNQPLLLPVDWLPDDPDEPDENEYLSVECPSLAISAFGADRMELWKCIRGDICFAWRHFVQAEDSKLASDAQAIKDHYLSIAEAVDG